MDQNRFDDIAKNLASGADRRAVLKRMGGGILGGLLAAAGVGAAQAAQKKGGYGQEKVDICHCQGEGQKRRCKTLHIPEQAAKKHLGNYEEDYRGKCKSTAPTCPPPPKCKYGCKGSKCAPPPDTDTCPQTGYNAPCSEKCPCRKVDETKPWQYQCVVKDGDEETTCDACVKAGHKPDPDTHIDHCCEGLELIEGVCQKPEVCKNPATCDPKVYPSQCCAKYECVPNAYDRSTGTCKAVTPA